MEAFELETKIRKIVSDLMEPTIHRVLANKHDIESIFQKNREVEKEVGINSVSLENLSLLPDRMQQLTQRTFEAKEVSVNFETMMAQKIEQHTQTINKIHQSQLFNRTTITNNAARIDELENKLQMSSESLEVYRNIAEMHMKAKEDEADKSISELEFMTRSLKLEFERLEEVFKNTNTQIDDVQSNLDMFKADCAVDLDSVNFKIQQCTSNEAFEKATSLTQQKFGQKARKLKKLKSQMTELDTEVFTRLPWNNFLSLSDTLHKILPVNASARLAQVEKKILLSLKTADSSQQQEVRRASVRSTTIMKSILPHGDSDEMEEPNVYELLLELRNKVEAAHEYIDKQNSEIKQSLEQKITNLARDLCIWEIAQTNQQKETDQRIDDIDQFVKDSVKIMLQEQETVGKKVTRESKNQKLANVNTNNELKIHEERFDEQDVDIQRLWDAIASLQEIAKIDQQIILQDEIDKQSIQLLGVNIQNGNGLEQQNKTIFRFDKQCISCQGNMPAVMNAYKMACLAYVPSQIQFQKREFSRTQLIEVREKIAKDVSQGVIGTIDFGEKYYEPQVPMDKSFTHSKSCNTFRSVPTSPARSRQKLTSVPTSPSPHRPTTDPRHTSPHRPTTDPRHISPRKRPYNTPTKIIR